MVSWCKLWNNEIQLHSSFGISGSCHFDILASGFKSQATEITHSPLITLSPSPRPVLLPLMHEGNATVGRMSLSVGLDVGQGGGARVDYSVALPLVYMHCCCRPRVDYSGHSPKSDTSCWPATLLQSQVHPSLETLQLLDKGWLTGGTIAWDTFGFLRTSNLRILYVIKPLHRRDP